MKLDCVRIQSHRFVQGTSVPEFLLLIRDDFTYDAYHYTLFFFIRNKLTIEPSKFLKKVTSQDLKVS